MQDPFLKEEDKAIGRNFDTFISGRSWHEAQFNLVTSDLPRATFS
jgi:hypothetical protein